MTCRASAAAAALILMVFGSAFADDDLPDVRRTGGLIRAHWDYPAEASVGFGVIVTKMPGNFDCKTTCNYRGATIQGSAGFGAGELAIGYGSVMGETGHGDWLLRRVFVGYGLRAALLRTWGESNLTPEGRTYWGVEGAVTISQFNMMIGVFRPVSPSDDLHSWYVFGGAGWGF